jgi:hypothetical protein
VNKKRHRVYVPRKSRLSALAIVITCWIAPTVHAGAKEFLRTHNPADSHFLISIERVGPCKISTPPLAGVRVPYQLYPPWSVQYHEEGTVQMELVFDADWCVRKASIVQSTGHWRLDQVSLEYMMTVKYQPSPERLKLKDGEPTTVVKLGWGASQGRH